MSAPARRYCWRTGFGLELADGERCPECGCSDHREIPAGECGTFVGHRDHGHGCELPPGHGGFHAAPEACRECDDRPATRGAGSEGRS